MAAVVGTGLLGGYTTFSTASFETVRLLEDRAYVAAALNDVGHFIVSAARPTLRAPELPSASCSGRARGGAPFLGGTHRDPR